MSKNIVVVGGGTAGWITALYTLHKRPDDKITLIESDQIGVLGAGEGTTPHLLNILEEIGIGFTDLIMNCKATLKNGAMFKNWGGEDSYVHPFNSDHKSSNDYNFVIDDENLNTSFSHIIGINQGSSLSGYSLMQKLSNENKVPYIDSDEYLSSIAVHAISFDANILADYLRFIGISRGIIREEGIVEQINTDDANYIVSLKTNKKIVPADFVFDCTGFKRLIIGSYYKSKWHSHSSHLPVNRAIPFFLPAQDPLPPYTNSVAMDYGWMWNTPLQHRTGCGYVFDSNFISDDEAKKEVDEYFGFEVESPRAFDFNAGCYEEVWINNCLAVGLSSGFIEPLEATAIWQSVVSLFDFFNEPLNIENKSPAVRNKFNRMYMSNTQEVVDLLYLHYVTNKTNTEFWADFTKNNTMPEFVAESLDIIKYRPLIKSDFENRRLFPFVSYFYVMSGNGLITHEYSINHIKFINEKNFYLYRQILKEQDLVVPNCISHDKFIKYFNGEGNGLSGNR